MSGNTVLAKALASQKLEYCFGIVGVPVLELGAAIQAHGIKYYGFRNEQAASYSAQAVGYLTGRPGICLCVSGPGMVHGVAGLANAWSNNWPMILIAGASDTNQDGKGGFQESNQLSLAQTYCKFAYRITDVRQIPMMVEKAVKISISGRPGPVYLELPGDILGIQINDESIEYPPLYKDIPVSQTSDLNIQNALQLLNTAQKPLLIIGKGCQYAKAEQQLQQFIDQTNIPFLPTPLGKGLVSDNHPQCVGPARSTALGQADVILLAGARLNWILHFGKPPRFQKNVKIIQIDICPEEFDTNVRGSINLLGDIKEIFQQFNQQIKQNNQSLQVQKNSPWWQQLAKKCQQNKEVSLKLMLSDKTPMSHYQALHQINQYLPKDFFYVAEGGNTMDIGRTIISQTQPRTKLDAGTYGTMGIGLPFAIAAQAVHPLKPIVCIFGDSAFGFSAMEIETAARYNMPLVIFILNNNGIFFGHEEMPEENNESNLSPTSLKIETRYEKMADAFGGIGIFVKTQQQLQEACKQAFQVKKKNLYIINVMIDPFGVRKPQEHSWLTKEEVKPKL